LICGGEWRFYWIHYGFNLMFVEHKCLALDWRLGRNRISSPACFLDCRAFFFFPVTFFASPAATIVSAPLLAQPLYYLMFLVTIPDCRR